MPCAAVWPKVALNRDCNLTIIDIRHSDPLLKHEIPHDSIGNHYDSRRTYRDR